MDIDYLIVGAGLTGATIARRMHDAGFKVLVVDRRGHVGGNVYDQGHESGIRIHTYGPHYFRTSSETIWNYVNRFADFFRYEGVIKSLVSGRFENWPVADEYIRRTVGADWTPSFSGPPSNFEEASLAMMPREIYERFVKGYSEKQWGVPAASLGADLAGRFEVRADNDPRLKRSTYQGIPCRGYAQWMASMLSGIPTLLSCDFRRFSDQLKPNRYLIYTGPIDEFFDYRLGKLGYRGQIRKHVYHPEADLLLPCGQVNHPAPEDGEHIRTLEWKHMMPADFARRIKGTVLTTETTFTPDSSEHYEYPMPNQVNRERYAQYKELAAEIPRLLVCGRLGEYRYFDMDQAIGRALKISDRLIALSQVSAAHEEVRLTTARIRELNEKLLTEEKDEIRLEA